MNKETGVPDGIEHSARGARDERDGHGERGSLFLKPSPEIFKYGAVVLVAGWLAIGVALRLAIPDQAMRFAGPLVAALLVGLAFVLLNRGQARLAAAVVVFGAWVLTTGLCIFNGGVRAPVVIAYPGIIILVGWLFSARTAMVMTGLSLATLLGLVLAEANGVLPGQPTTPSTVYAAVQAFITVLSGVMTYFLVNASQRRLEQLTSIEDALARRTVELELAHADLNRAQAVARMGSWVYDITTDALSMSAETARILGLPAGTVLSPRLYLMMVHPDEQAAVKQVWQDALKGGSVDYEHRVLVGPSVLWVRHKFWVELDANGRATRAVGITQDISERKQAEAAQAEAQGRLQKIASRLPGVIYQYRLRPDGRASFPYASDAIKDIYRLTPEEVRDSAACVVALIHPDDADSLLATTYESARNLTPWHHEYRVRFSDGTVRWLQANSVPEREADGSTLWHGFLSDVTDRKHIEEVLQTSLNDKVALLNEVHHRVKNNLQIITSLLRLEAGRSTQGDTKSVLKDMQGRIRTMALLHESLYRSGTFAGVDLGAYLQQLATQAFRSMAPNDGSVTLQLTAATVQVTMDQATPCGLLLNELISNCLKHGFPPGQHGEVHIELEPVAASAQVRLRVGDNGVGLPPGFDLKANRTLGLQLVSDLTRQIGGTLETGSGPGTVFTVTFLPSTPSQIPKAVQTHVKRRTLA